MMSSIMEHGGGHQDKVTVPIFTFPPVAEEGPTVTDEVLDDVHVPVMMEAKLTKCPRHCMIYGSSLSLALAVSSLQRIGWQLRGGEISTSITGGMWSGRSSVSWLEGGLLQRVLVIGIIQFMGLLQKFLILLKL